MGNSLGLRDFVVLLKGDSDIGGEASLLSANLKESGYFVEGVLHTVSGFSVAEVEQLVGAILIQREHINDHPGYEPIYKMGTYAPSNTREPVDIGIGIAATQHINETREEFVGSDCDHGTCFNHYKVYGKKRWILRLKTLFKYVAQDSIRGLSIDCGVIYSTSWGPEEFIRPRSEKERIGDGRVGSPVV